MVVCVASHRGANYYTPRTHGIAGKKIGDRHHSVSATAIFICECVSADAERQEIRWRKHRRGSETAITGTTPARADPTGTIQARTAESRTAVPPTTKSGTAESMPEMTAPVPTSMPSMDVLRVTRLLQWQGRGVGSSGTSQRRQGHCRTGHDTGHHLPLTGRNAGFHYQLPLFATNSARTLF